MNSCKKKQFSSQITEFVTFHNVSFSALDSTDFLGFGRHKNQKVYFFFRFFKNKKHGALRNWISEGSMFFVFKKSKEKVHFLVFVTPPNFVNIQIFHTFPRVLWDIVATSCMLPYKCHTYLESLWSLLFVGISQHDAMFIKIEENWVWSPKADFFNFLTVSDIF